ncbi:MAG: TetR/AcrR family transcriptional regulator [Actinomycetota bacterium]
MALMDVSVAIPPNLSADDALDRREHLMAAAARVLVRDGSAGMRVRDVAVEAGVSTGIVHYYFGSKDEMLVDALRWAIGKPAERFAALRRDGDYLTVLATLLEVSLPHPGVLYDEYVLWLELWTAATHDASLQPLCEELAADYRDELVKLVQEGTAAGAFHPVSEPEVVAERISAMVDGLCFRTVVGYSWTPLGRVRGLIRSFACEQLGVDLGDLPEIQLSRREQSS